MSTSYLHIIRGLTHDVIQHKSFVVSLFVLVNIAAVSVGLVWPKTYTSSTTIFVEEKNIIQPLMQGAAVATDVRDRAGVAKDLLFGRKNLNEVLDRAGWFKKDTTEIEKDRLMDRVKARTKILNVGRNLIKIEYTDSNPERAFKTAETFAKTFVQESVGTQTHESQAAFDFIDSQVKMYHEKLTSAEQGLKEFRSQTVDARPGTEEEVQARINALQNTIEKTSLDLKEAQVKEASIDKQLSGEAEMTASLTREAQYASRIAELQSQLENLRLSYRDTYPDIVRIKHQIDDLKEMVVTEQKQRDAARKAGKSGGKVVVDESVRVNPMYQQLRRDLYASKTNMETLKARLDESKLLLNKELERARRIHSGEAEQAELTRDYTVNRDIYQDLLRRRENARVSRNMDQDKQGLSLKINEPAFLPLQPSGLRFMHFMIGGILLGMILPVAVLFGVQKVDPRIKLPVLISEKTNLPLLVVVPHLTAPAERAAAAASLRWHFAAVLVTLGFVATTGVLRAIGAI
ncbi:MAG: XrtA system polysaccharide chain length determinant [Sulfuricaulis sp.]